MPHGPVWPFGGAIFSWYGLFSLIDPNTPPYVSHSATLAVALAMVTSHRGLSRWPCLLLLFISLVNHPDQHDAHACVWQTWRNAGRPRRPCRPLFPAVTTGDCGCRARCRTSFARCERAHMWAEVISASATRVCWISAGVGAESGPPPGLIVPVFWHAELNSLLHQTPD